jgi:hypothetical protein
MPAPPARNEAAGLPFRRFSFDIQELLRPSAALSRGYTVEPTTWFRRS